MAQEVRATSSTGGSKGRKLSRFALLPFDALWAVAEVFGKGAEKYDDRNWERGYPWDWSADALQRHFTLFWQFGHDYDTVDGTKGGKRIEGVHTGRPHVAQMAWHSVVLVAFWLRGIGTDTRPKVTYNIEDLESVAKSDAAFMAADAPYVAAMDKRIEDQVFEETLEPIFSFHKQEESQCGAWKHASGSGYVCTRRLGHAGKHHAHIGKNNPCLKGKGEAVTW